MGCRAKPKARQDRTYYLEYNLLLAREEESIAQEKEEIANKH